MKVGKIPVAAIILIVIALVRIIMNRFSAGQDTSESSLITGMFFGAALVYLLYYINIYYTAWMNNRSTKKDFTK